MNDPRETIKQLLRLAKDPTAAEAARALLKARELAVKHRLSLDELDLEKDLEAIAEKAFPVGKRISFEHKLASLVAERHFNVRVVISRPELLIFGTEPDIVIAEYVIDYLVTSVRHGVGVFKAEEKHARRKWFSAKRESYIRGFFNGVFDMLKPAIGSIDEASQHAIIKVYRQRIDAHVKQSLGGQLTMTRLPKTRRNSSAASMGFKQGQNTPIHNPISKNSLIEG